MISSTRQGTSHIKKDLRAILINNANFENLPWVTKTPYDIRDAAMIDVLNAYKNNLAKKNKKLVIGFKKKKASNDSLAIHSKNYKSKGIFYSTFFGKESIKSAEELPDKLEYDARSLEHVLDISTSAFPKNSTNTLDLYKTRSLLLILGSEPFVLNMNQMGSSWS
jgi:hypothetical protein